MIRLFMCSLVYQLLAVCGQNSSKAYPWRDATFRAGSPVTCPAGPYLSNRERQQRESFLATWLPPNIHPPVKIHNYEDGIKWLNPQCTHSTNLTEIRESCGAWSRLKKWSEYKCIDQLPNSAQSEYFILSEVPNTPRLVISRVWKTGSTALAQVFKCLYGRVFLQYASLHKHRGPFIDSAESKGPFKHAILVRNPLDRFISGYIEILARLTFGPRPDATFKSDVKAYGMIDFKSEGPVDVLSSLRAAPGWPRIGHGSSSEYDWLWVGKPQDHDSPWDEESRFRAFIKSISCGEATLWWAHVASASWFVSGPRHVLTKQEAMEAKKAGASSPWRAAVMLPPLDLHHVVRHESFVDDVSALLELSDAGRGIPHPLKAGGQCHSVISKPHNSGNEGSLKRSHLPRSSFYNQLFMRDPVLLCNLVRGLLFQDYVCFDYALPPLCQRDY